MAKNFTFFIKFTNNLNDFKPNEEEISNIKDLFSLNKADDNPKKKIFY